MFWVEDQTGCPIWMVGIPFWKGLGPALFNIENYSYSQDHFRKKLLKMSIFSGKSHFMTNFRSCQIFRAGDMIQLDMDLLIKMAKYHKI